jgi:hypothetical protein
MTNNICADQKVYIYKQLFMRGIPSGRGFNVYFNIDSRKAAVSARTAYKSNIPVVAVTRRQYILFRTLCGSFHTIHARMHQWSATN